MKLLEQNISPLGMGCWAIGGDMYIGDVMHGYANANDDDSIKTIHTALDAGITLFDTAIAYGAGHSERLLGEALKGRPDVLIVSKLGHSIDEKTRRLTGEYADAECVTAAIEGSLGRLQRDHVDIMLLHLNALPVSDARPVFDAMEKARQAGKIRAFGWSTDFTASIDAMAPMEGFVAVEHAMNVLLDSPSVQKSVEENVLAALIRSPLAMGALTGKFTANTTVASNDVRALNQSWRDYFHDGKVPSRYLKKLEAIRDLLQTGGRTLSQGALCWLLAKSNHNIPIPGARNPDQMLDNAGALDHGPLPQDVMVEIETLIDREPEGEPRAR